jgi:hypothetical protein
MTKRSTQASRDAAFERFLAKLMKALAPTSPDDDLLVRVLERLKKAELRP